MSEQCVYFSFNRLARVSDKEQELFFNVEKKLSLITKKYNFYLDINNGNLGEYKYLTIHYKKPLKIVFFNKEIFDLPEIEESIDFYHNTEKLIIELSEIYPIINKLSFSSPGKRFFVK